MRKIYFLLITLVVLGKVSDAQVTVTGGSTATYSNVNAAFAAINAGTHFGSILIDITASTIEGPTGYLPTPLNASGQGPANYTSIVLRPSATATIAGDVATGRGVLELDGVDNFTFDGDIIGGPVQRDLTISCTASLNVAATAAIRFIGRTTLGLGTSNNTIKNCVISGNTPGNDGVSGSTVANSYGVYAGNNAVALTSGSLGDNYDSFTITNNEFIKAYFGLYIGSTTTNPGDNNLINNNIFGSAATGLNLTNRGVLLSNLVTSTVTLNEIFNMKVSTSISNAALEISGASSNSVIISRNKIYSIWSTSTGGWGAYGISLIGGNNHLLTNNVIYDINTTNYNSLSTTFQAFGIRITSGTGHKIYYNSVNLFGPLVGGSTTNAYNAAFMVSSTAVTGLDIRNNVFNNKMTTTATSAKLYAMWFPASYNFLNATINNNAYMVTNDAIHFVGKIGTTALTNDLSNLAAWQAFSQVNNATNDIQSVPPLNTNAPFISDVNLNFNANTITPIESGAILIPALGTNIDYNANVRPLAGINPNTNPDMGAYEFDGLAGVATDAGVIALVNPLANGCYSAAENVVVTIKNYGTAAISSIPVQLVVSGAINQTLTGTYAGTIAPSATFNFSLGTINMSAAGVYSFNATTNLPGDLNTPNDAMSQATRTVIAPSPIPQFVDFTGFTGANLPTPFPLWNESAGSAVPSGTTSSWTSQAALNNATNTNARVFLSATAANEWIVGPKILATANTNISFDAALTLNTTSPFTPATMGSDDKLRVMVSTDCGVSYSPIFTVSAANSLGTNFTNFTVPLGAYAGQNIIVALLAQDGPVDDPEAYYFQLDNINLYNASPTDAGISGFVTPGNACYTAAEPIIVTVNNYGTAAISNFSVNAWVSGAVTQTLTATYTGTLAVAASGTLNLGTVNMTTPGQYNFKGFTSLTGDLNNINDTIAIVKTALPLGTLPQSVSFTGYTGANLTTVFPDWREGDGALLPNGTTSSWINQANFPASGNVNARVFLSAAANTEWIVGPKVLATASTQVSFDAGLTLGTTSPFVAGTMGSDDKVLLMISNDCGASFTPIFTISATNSLTANFTNFNVSLSAYAGQEIIVGFLATDGPIDDPESYYFHLDNINLYNNSSTDGGVTAVLSPTINACLSANEPIIVTVKNFGLASLSNFPVTAVITGPLSATLTSNFTGTLAPGASTSFTIGTANMNVAGSYTVDASTNVAGDANGFNNSSSLFTTLSPAFGITGGNLICTSGSATLSVVGAASTYTWFNSSTSSSIVVNPTSTTTYSALGTGGPNNCQVSAFFTVTVNNPTITAVGAAVCGTAAVATLSANAFAPVTWYATSTPTNPLATGNTFTASAATTTTYYAQANSTNTGSIATTYTAGNGSNGNMFDVTALSAITINSVDVMISSVAISTVEVWYRVGSFVGFESSNTGWTLAGTGVVMGAGNGNPVPLNVNLGINIPSGQTYGLYVTANGGATFGYSNGTAVGNLFTQNSDLSIFEGKGGSYFAVTIATRVWNGNIHYTKQGCSSPIVPVTLTVSSSPTITLGASQTSVCAGSTVNIGSTGANTYTWSTGANGALISPTINATTTYSVIGETAPGCSATASIQITANALPTVAVASSNSILCNGQTATLTASGANTYVWSTTSTNTVITVAPTSNTTYTVTGTGANGCTKAIAFTQSVTTCVGIDANSSFSNLINVFPNPSNGLINTEFNFEGNKELVIMNAVGQIIKTIKTTNNSEVIDLREYAKGIYFVKIMSGNSSANYRIITE
ncbi:MAG: T9SS type A sorting domain-containing protein [Bacteroidia bacterium]|nr:T9SS type A sorting domain-containing protein [Bacteroidia bacterium]